MRNDGMGIYEKNIDALTKYQPHFIMPKIVDDEGFKTCSSVNGIVNIMRLQDGEAVYLHDGNDPVADAKKQTEQMTLNGSGLVVSFGLGAGYEAREIIKKMDKGTNFIIAEPSAQIFKVVLESIDLTDVFTAPNVHVIMYDDKQSALYYIQKFVNETNYKNMLAFVLKPYVELYFQKCKDLFFVMDDLRMSFEMNEATIKRFTSVWQRNAIKNIPHNLNSYIVSDFVNKFSDMPAVIVSAGPSLLKNVDLLKGQEDSCLIISVDTALKTLVASGITPHFVVSVDAQEIVLKKFENVDYGDIPLIYVPVSSAGVLNKHSGKTVLSVAQDGFFRNELVKLGRNIEILEMGGSVATCAFSFAQKAGCDPIILIGQDLAYTGMKSHAAGSAFEHDVDINRIGNIVKVESSDGGFVYTDMLLQTYITWFETYAASDLTGRTFIDATEGGAKINGFDCMTLKDAIDEHFISEGVKSAVSKAFKGAMPLTNDEKKKIRADYKEAAKFLESIKNDTKKAAAQLERITALLSKDKPNLAVINNAYKGIAGFQQKLQNGAEMLEVIGISILPIAEKLNLAFENTKFDNEIEKNIFSSKGYAEYYNEIGNRCDEFLGELNEAIK